MPKDLPIKDIYTINLIKAYCLNKKDYRFLLFFLIGINTGLKVNEILELNVADVREKDYIIIKQCLAGIKKRLPINKEIKDLINIMTADANKNSPLFVSRRGKRLDRTIVYNEFKSICEDLGLSDDYSIASLRKTFGYHYYQKYKDLSFLQWLFNQTTVFATMQYIDVEENLSSRFNPEFSL